MRCTCVCMNEHAAKHDIECANLYIYMHTCTFVYTIDVLWERSVIEIDSYTLKQYTMDFCAALAASK